MQGEIKYNGKIIPYELTRSKIKNLYIYIKDKQVIVKAPVKLKEKDILDFINKKKQWIYQKLEEQKIENEKIIDKKDVEKLKNIVQNSIEKYEKILQVKPNQVKIKNIKYAWGSCSGKKNITINMKLANQNIKTIEYVVLHEMCHLKYMNHSKAFWNLVEQNMPDYKIYRKLLK